VERVAASARPLPTLSFGGRSLLLEGFAQLAEKARIFYGDDRIARRIATALRRRDAALRHIEQRRSRRTKEAAQKQKIAATRSMNGKGEGPLVEPTGLDELPIAADRNHQNGHR
jgi:hypothetical protein